MAQQADKAQLLHFNRPNWGGFFLPPITPSSVRHRSYLRRFVHTGFATLRDGNPTSFTTIDANGVATWEGDLSGQVSSLTADVEQIDKTVISKDHAAVFSTGGGTEYLFIQGGTTNDTSDDLIVQFGGLSATNLTDAGSAIQVNFSGTAS